MKLNFDYCKKCNIKYRGFVTWRYRFYFACEKSWFSLDEKSYCVPKKFENGVEIEKINEKEWDNIKQMEIIKSNNFKDCLYHLEHILDNQS